MPDRLVWAEINLHAYRQNLHFLRRHLKRETQMMAVVKANAYGHGAVKLAQVALDNGCSYLGVVCLYEAKQLRNAGITAPILLLNFLNKESFREAIELKLDITIMDEASIIELNKEAKKTNTIAKVHLKVDTGMHRAGCSPAEAVSVAQLISAQSHLRLEGIFTHLATTDEENLSFSREQLRLFDLVLNELSDNKIHPPLVHAANSAAVISLPESHYSMVRPGIATYGLSPFTQEHSSYKNFIENTKPVLSLKTKVIMIKELKVGDSVGYGRTFIAEKPTKIALIPVGYGDGFRRSPKNYGQVLINGQLATIVGRVSMDQSTIDITSIPHVNVGDEVVIIGKQKDAAISVDDVAQKLRTINYEVVTSLAARVSRNYV